MATTEADVIEALRPVEDPELHRSIVDLGMVRDVAIDGGVAAVRIALTIAGCPLRNEIQNRVTDAAVALDGIDRVDLDFTVMTDEERAAIREMLHGDPASTAGTHQAHGHAEGRAIPFADPAQQDPGPAHRLGQGRRGQVVAHHQPLHRPGPAGPQGRRRRRRRVGLLDPPDAGRRPRPGGDRPDAGAARVLRRALHLHGLLRRGGPAGHLAGADAAQGARAVPHRRLLGRPRLPAGRPAPGHRRHRPLARPVPAPGRGVRGDHAPAGGPDAWPSGPRSWARRSTSR